VTAECVNAYLSRACDSYYTYFRIVFPYFDVMISSTNGVPAHPGFPGIRTVKPFIVVAVVLSFFVYMYRQ